MVPGLFLTLKVELSFPNRIRLMSEQPEDDCVVKSRDGACALPPLVPHLDRELRAEPHAGLSSMLKDP